MLQSAAIRHYSTGRNHLYQAHLTAQIVCKIPTSEAGSSICRQIVAWPQLEQQ